MRAVDRRDGTRTGTVVRDLQRLFIEDWYLDTDEYLESALAIEPAHDCGGSAVQLMGTGPNSFNEALRHLNLTAFHTARDELIVTTPYFVPDDATAIALRTAARRGVDTILIVPAKNDSPLVAAASRSHYEPLLRQQKRRGNPVAIPEIDSSPLAPCGPKKSR